MDQERFKPLVIRELGEDKVESERMLAGVLDRILAFLIDGLILLGLGFFLSKFLYDFLYSIWPWGRMLGLTISILYFGVLGSKYGCGQTIGKRIMGTRIVSVAGDLLSLKLSILRYSWLLVPYMVLGIEQYYLLEFPYIRYLFSILKIGFVGLTLYLILFDSKSRQGLHDKFTQTFVVSTKTDGSINFPNTWRGHYLIFSVLLSIYIGGSITLINFFGGYRPPSEYAASFMGPLEELRQKVGELEYVHSVHVIDQTYYGLQSSSGTSGRVLQLDVTMKRRLSSKQTKDGVRDVARIVLANYSSLGDRDVLAIRFLYTIDIGIFWGRSFPGERYTKADWMALLP